MSENYIPIIGLEVHVELSTSSKMFCGCPADHFGKKPNSQTCPVCLGLPGALPVANERAIKDTMLIGLALNGKVRKQSKFDRKQYFYPDLPKGYQISQYDEPLASGGWLKLTKVKGQRSKVKITRIHLEEDTGKLLHRKVEGEHATLIDFNRSGVPLVEIVTEPEISSAKQAKTTAQKIRHLIRWLGVSDCDMDKGSMRIEANISLQKPESKNLPDYKVEVKNINSFRFLEKAINYEIKRQKKLLLENKNIKQETRGWDEEENKTKEQRYKETASDYRYFPEPDIPPMEFTSQFIDRINQSLPNLPDYYKDNFSKNYKLPEHYISFLTKNIKIAKFSEEAFRIASKAKMKIKDVAGFIVNKKIDINAVAPDKLVEHVNKNNMIRVSDADQIEKWVELALKKLPQAVDDYKNGKTGAIAALIGKVMKASKGKADPIIAKKILENKLK